MKKNTPSRFKQEEAERTEASDQICSSVPSVNFCALLLLLLATGNATAATRYVWQDSPSPAQPYTNWATAARVIQVAVDAAAPGDTVLVTNGLYATGGRAVGTNILVNRVAADQPLHLLSVNGPEVTIIQGYQVPVSTNGDGAIRCVYLTNGASLSGFTLTNGATRTDGDWEREARGGGVWCESAAALVFNCVLVGNSASSAGGGASRGTLNDCTLLRNSTAAADGGGAAGSTLNRCTVTGNRCPNAGGGTYGGILSNCLVSGNSARVGGGDSGGTLINCLVTGNSASDPNDGRGGGTQGSDLINCTVTGNSASGIGGGTEGGIARNSIVYFNTAASDPNHSGTAIHYSCTTPLPILGVGNVSTDPLLASPSHLSAFSPCRGSGSTNFSTGTDIDGESWANPPSMGCDEYGIGAVTGQLNVAIAAAYTNVATGFPVELTAHIEGRTTGSMWDFGDGTVVNNQPFTRHAWPSPGNYQVVLRAFNETHPVGVDATVTVQVVTQPVHYVAANTTDPQPPFASWETASATIQDAVDAATTTGALVLVTNGTYATGGRAVVGITANRVAVDKPVAVQSVNGPAYTVILGSKSPPVRCVFLANGAGLSGFTLTNGQVELEEIPDVGVLDQEKSSGGGVWCASPSSLVANCLLVSNWAGFGGGAYRGTLTNCLLLDNEAADYAGGAFFANLHACTLTKNSASVGGGVGHSTLNNCVVSSNSAGFAGGGAVGSTLYNCKLVGNVSPSGGGMGDCRVYSSVLVGNQAQSGGGANTGQLKNCTVVGNTGGGAVGEVNGLYLENCVVYYNSPFNIAGGYTESVHSCTTPLPFYGYGNITNAPLFVATNGWSNLRLQSNSPCINAGNNADAVGGTDLDGRPRIVGGTVDIGAYEFQGPGLSEFIGWLQQYGLSTDGSADYTDADLDGHNNWQEWKTWTIPTDPSSLLRLFTPQSDANCTLISWQGVQGQSYLLERATNAGSSFSLLQANIPGQAGTTDFTDTNAIGGSAFFYRVGAGN